MTFHEVRFPTDISRRSQGGPERRTDIVVLGSGFEERNARWADSRRSYDAGYGVKSLDDLHKVISFFEERRGRLYPFRWRDPADWSSTLPSQETSPADQSLGLGDGERAEFQLTKRYGSGETAWLREIKKPVEGSVVVAVDGNTLVEGTQFIVDYTLGAVTFLPGHIPAVDHLITAGYMFDVPVRFDTDRLELNMEGLQHGAIPDIPIVEVRL